MSGTKPRTGDWRKDDRAVALLTFDFDAESPILAEGSHYAEDLSTMSHHLQGRPAGGRSAAGYRRRSIA